MNELLVSLVSLIGVLLGSFVTYVFAIRARRDESVLRFKEEKYADLLVKLQGFIGVTTSAQTKKEFFEKQYQSWLYASDDVIRAINNMVRLVIESRGGTPDSELGRKAVGEIALAMRRDLLGKTSLSHTAFQYTDVIENSRK